jgi:hypothetical protein
MSCITERLTSLLVDRQNYTHLRGFCFGCSMASIKSKQKLPVIAFHSYICSIIKNYTGPPYEILQVLYPLVHS